MDGPVCDKCQVSFGEDGECACTNWLPDAWSWDFRIFSLCDGDNVILQYDPVEGKPLVDDAKVISAAPRLRAALENLLKTVKGDGGTKYNAIKAAELVIKECE